MVLSEFAVRRKLGEVEKATADAIAERNAVELSLRDAQQRIQELESRLDEESRESSDIELLRQRLAEEMEDERKQYQKDLADRDFSADQTRKKYFCAYLGHSFYARQSADTSLLAELASLSDGTSDCSQMHAS